MIIPETDYNITQNDVPVLTVTGDGTYIYTNCWLNDFNIESEHLENILSDFRFKDNILTSIIQYGHSPVYKPVLRVLTNSNIQISDFDISKDVLAVALFRDKGKDNYTWLDFFEVNGVYRKHTDKKYKRVGESALKSFQKQYLHQGIECRSNFDALGFYFKYGFKRIDERECHLSWGPQR
jgi:hypothetical protein